MMGTTHLCVFYVATAGLQGNSLGSDEEEVVLLIYVIIDMSVNKVSNQFFPTALICRVHCQQIRVFKNQLNSCKNGYKI